MRYLGRLFTLLGIALTVALVHSWIVPLPTKAPEVVDERVQLRAPSGVPARGPATQPGAQDAPPADEETSSDAPEAVTDPVARQDEPALVDPAAAQPVMRSRTGTPDAPCVAFTDQPLPSTVDITLEQARFLWGLSEAIEADFPGTQVQFIDARALPGRYAEGHIAGAWHLTNEMMDRGEMVWIDFQTLYEPPELGGDTIIVVYCDGGDCDESKNVRNRLFESGYTQTFIFTDGYPAWRDCGLPVVVGTDRFTSR